MTTALNDLIEKWGLGDGEIARALHTNPNVIRHWRKGVEPNSDEVARAGLLNGFLGDIREIVRQEPAVWMAEPLAEGFAVTRWDLYAAGCSLHLLRSNADGTLSSEALLHEFNPDWRRTYWTSFKTVQTEEGGMSIVGKTYDDVLAQVSEISQ